VTSRKTENEDIKTYISPIYGWRTWKLGYKEEDYQDTPCVLQSVVLKYNWPYKEPLVSHSYPCLRQNCSGIYAFNSPPEEIKEYMGLSLVEYGGFRTEGFLIRFPSATLTFVKNGIPYVLGQVALWGRTIRHKHGYRSEFAYPVKVWDLAGFLRKEQREYLGDLYGVPFGDVGNLEKEMKYRIIKKELKYRRDKL
jgi:hypothetical protein